ncbi:hypothetical protein [Arthrobacter sp.]|uniref:putative acetyltransferase n=1 Tax=Arthrobacter sp. TaxID=1667 RepID=UPI00339723AD
MIPATPSVPVSFLASAAPGTRVVVRYRIDGGLTDALGELLTADAETCTVRTARRGDVVVQLSAVTAAKQVPPAPPRRGPRAGRQPS